MFLLKILFALSSIFVVSANTNLRKRCRVNEEFVVDQYRCQNTCEYYGRNFDCQYDAPNGNCYCKKGFARMFENGPCISINTDYCRLQLPPTEESCSEKEIFSVYGGGDFLCGNACDRIGIPCERAVIAIVRWQPKCECIEGYSRLPNTKRCVPVESPECAEFYKPSVEYCKKRKELYSPFGSACQRTCADHEEYNMCWDDEFQRRRKRMILKGACYCPKGTTRINDGEYCIPIEQCPSIVPASVDFD